MKDQMKIPKGPIQRAKLTMGYVILLLLAA